MANSAQDLAVEAQRRSMFWRDLYAKYNPDFAIRNGINMPEITQSAGGINRLIGGAAAGLAGRGGTGSQYRVAEEGLARSEGARAAQAEMERKSKAQATLKNIRGGVGKQGENFGRALGIGARDEMVGNEQVTNAYKTQTARERADQAVADSKRSGLEAFVRGIGGGAGDLAGEYLGRKLFDDEED